MLDRGYSFDSLLLNSSNFGLPQNRLRLYMVGFLNKKPKLNLISDLGPKDSHSYNYQQLSLLNPFVESTTVADILEDSPDAKYNCSSNFINALKKVVDNKLDNLHGRRLIDYRGGNSIHSWELGLKGECSDEEIQLMNQFILKRRNKEFGQHQDGKLLTEEQISTFYKNSNLNSLLESLVSKKYLQVINGKYKPVAGNFSFEVYKFLDPNKIAVTLVASDANRLGIYHKGRVRRITPREAARIQGFPDRFILDKNDDKAYYQLGNSVSINVVKAVAEEIFLNLVNSRKYQPEKSNLVYC